MLRHAPAGISLARLFVAVWLLRLAWQGKRTACSTLMAVSVLADLADGILARRVGDPVALRRQRRIDRQADAVFTVAAPLAACRLCPEAPGQLRMPIAALVLVQAAGMLACLSRFRRLPRYYSSAYKWCAGAVGLALAGRVAGGYLRVGLRPALWLLTLAHLEALGITLLLDSFRQPVRSIRWVRLRRADVGIDCAVLSLEDQGRDQWIDGMYERGLSTTLRPADSVAG